MKPTPRERVLSTVRTGDLSHLVADYHGTVDINNRLMEHLGVTTYPDLLAALGTDIVDIRGIVDPLWTGPVPDRIDFPDGSWQNHLGFRMKRVKTDYGFEDAHCDQILKDANSIEDVERVSEFRWPRADWFDFSGMPEALLPYDDLAVMASGASVFQHASIVRGMDNLLCDLMVNRDLALYLMDGYVSFYLEYYDRMFEACGGRIDILRIADDLGMQDRLLVSPDIFREVIAPRIGKLASLAHRHGALVMFHTCGAVREFIPDLVAAGVDILDPVQITAAGMDPQRLADEFGATLAFHGGVDTQYTLPKGSPDTVREEVRSLVASLGREGKYIVAPSHIVQPDVPVENILALYEEVHSIRSELSKEKTP